VKIGATWFTELHHDDLERDGSRRSRLAAQIGGAEAAVIARMSGSSRMRRA
jgi:hypothetical protein